MKHKHAELIHAWADGAEIEVLVDDYDGAAWQPVDFPNWWVDMEYRIKPTPKPDVVAVARAYPYASSIGISRHGRMNLRCTFDGETGKLKSAEIR